MKNLPTGLAAIANFGKQLQAQCPGVLAGAPKSVPGVPPTMPATEFAEEELLGIFGVAELVESARLQKFARAVAALRWSDRTLTRIVRSYARAEVVRTEIPTHLCADGQAWVASGYQAVSAATLLYLQREALVTKKTEGVEEKIRRRLTRYENQAARRIVKRIAKLEDSAVLPVVGKLLTALAKVHEVLHGPSIAASG